MDTSIDETAIAVPNVIFEYFSIPEIRTSGHFTIRDTFLPHVLKMFQHRINTEHEYDDR